MSIENDNLTHRILQTNPRYFELSAQMAQRKAAILAHGTNCDIRFRALNN
jgi:hypothetical protein